jgi:hypothetical protein
MPILEVEVVTHPGETLPAGLASVIADQVGEIFGSNPGGTWVRLRTLAASAYAEDGGGPEPGIFPVFVSILKSRLPAPEAIEIEAGQLAQAIGSLCGRPSENVHILYLPEAAGRIAFGGKLQTGRS